MLLVTSTTAEPPVGALNVTGALLLTCNTPSLTSTDSTKLDAGNTAVPPPETEISDAVSDIVWVEPGDTLYVVSMKSLRIIWLFVSLTKILPDASTARPVGALKRAAVPTPSLVPDEPAKPAIVETV